MSEDKSVESEAALFFAFFTEVGILAQLSRALLESRLPDGVSVAHYSVLNHLVRVCDGQTPLTLARAFQVPKNSMTHTLSGLEARGLIAMHVHPDDGRSKQVWITQDGRDFQAAAVGLLKEDVARLIPKLDTEQLEELTTALGGIRKVLDDDRSVAQSHAGPETKTP